MKKILSIYPALALVIFLASLAYVPAKNCTIYDRSDSECHDIGWVFFTDLGTYQKDEYSDIDTIKTDVYVIQNILIFVALFGIYRILITKIKK